MGDCCIAFPRSKIDLFVYSLSELVSLLFPFVCLAPKTSSSNTSTAGLHSSSRVHIEEGYSPVVMKIFENQVRV